MSDNDLAAVGIICATIFFLACAYFSWKGDD